MRLNSQPPVRWFLRALLAALLLAAGCTTGTRVDPARPDTARSATLPVLGDLLRAPADTGTGLVRFRTAGDALAGQAAEPAGTTLVLNPAWPLPATGGSRVAAWSGYGFNLADYTGAEALHVRWAAGEAPEPGSWYLGLSDFATGTWEWVTGGSASEYGIPGSLEFSTGDGAAYAVVVVLGTAACRLEWLRVGDNLPPLAELATGLTTGPAPLATSFDAAGSSDPDGIITGYEWDLDGDGEFNEAGAEAEALGSLTVEHTYTAPGSYNPAVRISDDTGATAVRTAAIDVASSAFLAARSWGSAGEDVINAVLAGPDGNLYLAGSTTGFGQGQSDVLILKYSAEGELLWSRTWGAIGVDTAAALAIKGPDTLYVAGKTTIPDGGEVALVVEYGTDGTWRDTIIWGTC